MATTSEKKLTDQAIDLTRNDRRGWEIDQAGRKSHKKGRLK